VGNTFLADEAIYEASVRKAWEAQKSMKSLPSFVKYDILKHIAGRLTEEAETLSLLLSGEAAKPLKYARAEVRRSIQTFTVAAEESKRLPREYIALDWTPIGEKREGLIKYFPSGTVAGISPFNFPLNLAVHKIAPAIAAGCPIVLKPASSTPLSSLFLAKIIAETALPKGAVSILPMNRDFADRMVTDPRFSLLSFTGSPEVGWSMKNKAGKKKTVLELGGNAAVIISSSAKVEEVIPKCIQGAFAYQGQICIHAQRFFVHEQHMPVFLDMFLEAASRLVIGPPDDDKTDFTCMIDTKNAERVEEWIHQAESEGAEILMKPKRIGNLIHPTVILNARKGMKVYDEEVFGPVITITPFSDFDEAVLMVNDSRFGLQAGVFTDSQTEIDKAFHGLEVGGVILNDVPTLRFDHMPYGGVKDSGLGREGVKYAMMDMLEPRILVKQQDV
jgi:glyceraldehyde-3-phosphate dehydrogenase (NADP+)